MTNHRIAFLTLSDRSGFFVYDHLAFAPLAELGWSVDEVAWDSDAVRWRDYRGVVIRSTWDYQSRVDSFLAVLEKIHSLGVPLMNSIELVRWNLSKTYLRELSRSGIPIIPTHWVSRFSDEESVDRYFQKWNVDQFVVKPLIGANADDTFRVSKETPSVWDAVKATFRGRGCMVQPFVDSILSQGEYSLFYFGGRYSHCVVKKPADNDYRVQEEHGGSIASCDPPLDAIQLGQRVVASLPHAAVYARVDLVTLAESAWAVIEVELIEPSLYFPYNEDSPRRFAEVLDATLRSVDDDSPTHSRS